MTIIHIDIKTFDSTIWFDNPLPKFTHISLISCDFINMMVNLSSEGTISDPNNEVLLRIPKGNYKKISQVKAMIDKAMYLGEKPVKIEGNVLTTSKSIKLNKPLAELLGLETTLEAKSKNNIQLDDSILAAIYVHCSMVDSNKVFLDNKYSQVLAYIPIKDGRISHNPERVYIPTINSSVNKIRFWVTVDNNKLIKDGFYPMHIVLELI